MVGRLSVILLVAITALVLVFMAGRNSSEHNTDRRFRITDMLAATDTAGFAKADRQRSFRFPDDHGPHPAYKTEWWYYTGNLKTDSERMFGFQLTFFRSGLSPALESDDAWQTNQLYMAHFTISDISEQKFYAFERFSRAALGLAGAQAKPFRVWLENWFVAADPPDSSVQIPQMKIYAEEQNVRLDLNLKSAKTAVLQGEGGLSQKSAAPGNASYYYTLSRLLTGGRIYLNGEIFEVSGFAWMDREWSTSALGEDQVGWDWFSLQFDNGYEMMYYQIRLQNGSADVFSKGVLIDPAGAAQPFRSGDIRLTVTEFWQSPNGARYPAGWQITLADQALDLNVKPLFNNQELDLSFRYWEGAVSLSGTHAGQPVNGNGYIELTGYEQ